MIADIGTKALSTALFQHLSDYILGVKPPLELMDLPEFSKFLAPTSGIV
jgi:hypothetical protein